MAGEKWLYCWIGWTDSSFAIKLLYSFTHSYSNTYKMPGPVLGPRIEMTSGDILREPV